jgi:tRNA1(Val) A37 N6-methylase TrmN6
MSIPDAVSEDAILGGRLVLLQPRQGHRFGHDAILLAAACPARPGDHVFDLGAGVGAAGLALARRVADLSVALVEIDPDLAALAKTNVQANGFSGSVRTVTLDATADGRSFAQTGLTAGSAMHVLMNPPFWDEVRQQSSPDRRRAAAHVGSAATLPAWVATAARLLRPRGTLTLIWRADGLLDVLAALAKAFGGTAVLPIYGRPGRSAIRILVRAIKGSRAPLELLPGLTLNDSVARPTPEAQAVLRDGAPLFWWRGP